MNGLVPGSNYSCCVAACNAAGVGTWSLNSEPITAMTYPPFTTMSPIVNVNGIGSLFVSCPIFSPVLGQPIAGFVVLSVDKTPIGPPPLTISGLTLGMDYAFYYAASNLVGIGSASAISTAVTAIGLPNGVPTGTPIAVVSGPSMLTISAFSPVPSTKAFPVQYYAASRSGIIMGGSVATDTPSITVYGLSPGISYSFYVAASNDVGVSASWSTISSPTTAIGVPTCNINSIAKVNGDCGVNVTYTTMMGGIAFPITNYVIRTFIEGISTILGSSTQLSGQSTIYLPGLTAGMQYDFYVAGSNYAGTGSYSTIPSRVTAIHVPGSAAMIVPMSYVVGDSVLAVTFPANITSNVASPVNGYAISTSIGGTIAGFTTSNSWNPVITVTGTPGSSPSFYVVASNSAGTGAWSTSCSSATTIITYPNSMQNISDPTVIFNGNRSAIMSFATVGSDSGHPINGFVISSDGVIIGSNTTTFTGNVTFPLTWLDAGISHKYYAAASNIIGVGGWSPASASFTAITFPPNGSNLAPLASNIGDKTISLTFNPTKISASVASPINGFVVSSNVSMNPIIARGITSPITLVNGILADSLTQYSYYVAASNAVGLGSPSTSPSVPIYAVTIPNPMLSAPILTIAGDKMIKVTFTQVIESIGRPINGYVLLNAVGAIQTTIAKTNSSVIMSGLVAGTTYQYCCAASNFVGLGSNALSNISTEIMALTVPATMTSPTVTASGPTQLTVSFTPVTSPAAGYPVNGYVLSMYNGTSTSVKQTITLPTTTFSVLTNANAGIVANGTTPYTFYVAASNSIGIGNASSGSSTIYAAVNAQAPSIIAAASTSTVATIVVTLTPLANSTLTSVNGYSYITLYTISNTSGGSSIGTVMVNPPSTYNFSFGSLTPGTTYNYYAVATNALGYGTWSSVASAKAITTPTLAPTITTSVTSVGTITVTITNAGSYTNTTSGYTSLTGFGVSTSRGGSITQSTTTILNNPQISIGGLNSTAGTSFSFYASALNVLGASTINYWSVVSTCIMQSTPPVAPTFSASVAGTTITITITFSNVALNNGGNSVTSFNVYSSPSNALVGNTTTNTYVISTNISVNNTYSYYVTAVNGLGSGVASSVKSILVVSGGTINTCGATGKNGPTLSQIQTSYNGSWISSYITSTTVPGVQTFTVPFTATYTFSTASARGGYGYFKNAGLTYAFYPYPNRNNGVVISGSIDLSAGEILYIVIGQHGEDSQNIYSRPNYTSYIYCGGGGGGTYIFRNALNAANFVMVVGGGGGDGSAVETYNQNYMEYARPAPLDGTGNGGQGYDMYIGNNTSTNGAGGICATNFCPESYGTNLGGFYNYSTFIPAVDKPFTFFAGASGGVCTGGNVSASTTTPTTTTCAGGGGGGIGTSTISSFIGGTGVFAGGFGGGGGGNASAGGGGGYSGGSTSTGLSLIGYVYGSGGGGSKMSSSVINQNYNVGANSAHDGYVTFTVATYTV